MGRTALWSQELEGYRRVYPDADARAVSAAVEESPRPATREGGMRCDVLARPPGGVAPDS